MEYSRCRYCKLSHTKAQKHIYSEKHRNRVKFLYSNFKKKVKIAKQVLKDVDIEPEEYENRHCFWCLFCEEEHQKHHHTCGTTIKYWNFLCHLSLENHFHNVEEFWKREKVKDQATSSYVVSEEVFESFKAKSDQKVQEFMSKAKQSIEEKTSKLKSLEEERKFQMLLAKEESFVTKHGEQSTRTNEFKNKGKPHSENEGSAKGFMTIAAKAEGLTCISIPKGNKRGNVHSGATPPWLTTDEDYEKSTDVNNSIKNIGPNIADYEQHLENERKRKLPPGRVGADFNGSTDSYDQSWMPSFGRVWSKNSRQNQKKWSKRYGHNISNSQVDTANRSSSLNSFHDNLDAQSYISSHQNMETDNSSSQTLQTFTKATKTNERKTDDHQPVKPYMSSHLKNRSQGPLYHSFDHVQSICESISIDSSLL